MGSGRVHRGRVLLVDVLVEHVDTAVEAEQVVELGHEVEGDGPGRRRVSGTGSGRGHWKGHSKGHSQGTYDWGRLLGFQARSGSCSGAGDMVGMWGCGNVCLDV